MFPLLLVCNKRMGQKCDLTEEKTEFVEMFIGTSAFLMKSFPQVDFF